MIIAEAFVAIRPKVDRGQFQREVSTATTNASRTAGEQAGSSFSQGLRSSVGRISLDLASAFGTVRFARGVNDAVKAASGLNEQAAATETIFGDAADQITRFAEGADQIGFSERAAREATNSFGALFRAMGAGEQESAQVSERLTRLAADLASFRDTPIEDAFTALRSGLVGEVEPLRRFGVQLSDVRLREEATALGLKTTAGQILPAYIKAQAAVSIILKDTAQAQGDVERTSGSLANVQRRTAAETENAAASLGQNFVPIYTKITELTGQLATVFGALPGPIQTTVVAFAGLAIAAPLILRARDALTALGLAGRGAAEGSTLAAGGVGKLGKALGLIAVFGAEVALVEAGIQALSEKAPGVERLTVALDALSKTGKVEGALVDSLGVNAEDLDDLVASVDSLESHGSIGLGRFKDNLRNVASGGELGTAINQINALDAALAQMVETQGRPAAASALVELVRAADPSLELLGRLIAVLPAYSDALIDSSLKQRSAAGSAKELTSATELLANSVETLFTPRREFLGVQDAIVNAEEALKDLEETRKDARGEGEASQRAAEQEQQARESLSDAIRGQDDAQRSLADAYESVAESQRRLLDAQREQAEFESGADARIRDLERRLIVTREVVTPEDVTRKELDLLRHDEQTSDRRASLAEAVANAQTGVTDALGRVSDAERGVRDAADRTAKAQGAVAEASQRRALIQVEAAAQVRDAEREAELAILAAGAALNEFATKTQPADDVVKLFTLSLAGLANTLDPSGVLARNIDGIVQKLSDVQREADVRARIPNFISADLTEQAVAFALGRPGQFTFTTEEIRRLLHQSGVPGFETGGVVPGPRGVERLIFAHGGERVQTEAQQREPEPAKSLVVNQTNNFIDSKRSPADAQFAARELGWMIARKGRRA